MNNHLTDQLSLSCKGNNASIANKFKNIPSLSLAAK